MSVFRAITAEEEAASALMFALQERAYDDARKLDPRDHMQKNALIPFFIAVSSFAANALLSVGLQAPLMVIRNEDGGRRLMIALQMGDTIAYPTPPLNFSTLVGSNKKPPSYKKQIENYLKEQGESGDIIRHARNRANERNTILYASADGFRRVNRFSRSDLRLRKARVMALMGAFLMIEPWHEKQPFVQDCLYAFLGLLRKGNYDLHAEI